MDGRGAKNFCASGRLTPTPLQIQRREEKGERNEQDQFFLLPTPHFLLPTSHFLLPTPHSPLPTPHFPLPTSYSPLPTSYFPLPTPITCQPRDRNLACARSGSNVAK